jgi:hypothetical protein
MPKPPDDTSDPQAFIAHDVACQRCAYNLRGLPRNGRCPECGAPVSVSLQGDLLRFADPAWLAKLSAGARLQSWVLYSFVFISIVIGGLFLWFGDFTERPEWGWLRSVGLVGLPAIACGFLFCGTWMVATPNPAMFKSESRFAPRRVLRMSVLAAVLGLGGSIALVMNASGSIVRWLIALAISPAGAVSLVGAWALCRHVRELADRLPDEFTQKQAAYYFRGHVISVLILAAGVVAAVTTDRPEAACACIIGGLGLPVFDVLCLFLPSYLEKSLRREIEKARQVWAEAGGEADSLRAK